MVQSTMKRLRPVETIVQVPDLKAKEFQTLMPKGKRRLQHGRGVGKRGKEFRSDGKKMEV